MKTILFQGDSITDVLRNRENDIYKGSGYATLVSARLGLDYPNQYTYINRGISGNRVVDLYARIKADIINLKPDYISILIGVNDVWHEISRQNGVSADKFERVYAMLLEEIFEALPNTKVMLLEPFVLSGTATEENYDAFSSEVGKRAAAVKRVAERFNAAFVPLQCRFDEALKYAPAEYWLFDGVHPTSAGHEIIAREWVKAFLSL